MKTLDSNTFSADPPEKPPVSRVKFWPVGIPKELQAIPRFLPWKWDWSPEERRWRKPPCSVNGFPVDCQKPENWMPFAEAVEAVFAKPDTFAGVGFCFGLDASGNPSGFAGWDCDGCRDPLAGNLASWAQQIEIDLDSYAEVSPSGTGIRIVCRATGLPPGKRKTTPPQERHWSCPPGGIGPSHVKYLPPQAMPNTNNKAPAIEVFVSSGYVTLTGVTLPSGPHPQPIKERSEKCHRLYGALWPSKKRPPIAPQARPQGSAGTSSLSDEELLSRAMESRDRDGIPRFRRLWEGDISMHNYDDSRASIALVGRLVWWARGDVAQVDQLFRRSRQMRPKWDEKRGDSTWGRREIETAIENATDFYDPDWKGKINTGGIGGGAGSMSRQQQAQEQTEPQETQEMNEEQQEQTTGTARADIDLRQKFRDASTVPNGAEPEGEQQETDNEPNPTPARRILIGAELLRLPEPEWLVEDFIQQKALVVMFGEPGCAKTFVALDLALSIAHGRETWHGRQIHQAGTVLYIAAEAVAEAAKRVRVWTEAHEIPLGDRFCVHPDSINFLHSGAVETLLEEIATLPALPVLIVVDTFAASIPGGDENSFKDVSQYTAACHRLRRETGATVLTLHHEGKNGDYRGHSSILGDYDTLMRVQKTGVNLKVSCSKQKGEKEFADIPFTLVTSGDSCIIASPDTHRLTPQERKVLVLMMRNPSGMRRCEIEKGADLAHGTFNRVFKGLEDKALIQGAGAARSPDRMYSVTPAGVALVHRPTDGLQA